MLKIFKRLFKNNIINNDKGSALSVAFIVIAVLTFSLTTVTSMNINLAGATTVKVDQVNSDSVAKGLIRQAIDEFEAYIRLTDSYTDFNNIEIPRILADYGVVVSDQTGIGEFLDYAGTDSYVYKFAIPMLDGDTLYKYVFTSIYGSSVDTFNVFDYSLGTNAQLILNSGYYDEVKLYGEQVKLSDVAPYIQNGTGTNTITPGSSATYPTLSGGNNPSTIFEEQGYTYCISGCYTTNTSPTPFTINESNYIDVDGSSLPDQGTISPMIINDFFGNFDYDAYVFDFVENTAPTEERTFTSGAISIFDIAQDIMDNHSAPLIWKNKNSVETYPSTPFVDITGDTNIDWTKAVNFGNMGSQGISVIHQGNLTITENIYNNGERDAFIIYGDLTIDSANNSQRVDGTFVVTGNLYFTGNDVDMEGSFFVFGETYINFADGEGIGTSGNNIGFSLLAKDNIIVESIFENHSSSAQPTLFSVFFYTEESIFVDAVNSRLYIEGALFSKGLGASPNKIYLNDELDVPIDGIIINSYRGYINNSGAAVPSTSDSANGFYIQLIANGTYQSRFNNIPVFESLIQIPGLYTFETSEWLLEDTP